MRVGHAVFGGAVAMGWLLLPVAQQEAGRDGPLLAVAAHEPAYASPGGRAAGEDETSTGDLVLPVVAVGAAGVLAVYAGVRRRRRASTRTTPGGAAGQVEPLAELEQRVRRTLIETDDSVRTSAEELGCAAGQFGDAAVGPFAEAVEYARTELASAFRIRQRLDDSPPDDDEERRTALEEIVMRCSEAGRRLDSEVAGFDRLRALDRDVTAALEHAETRFRELAGRTPDAEATLAELRKRGAAEAAPEHTETRFRELAGRTPDAEATLAELRKRGAAEAALPVAGHVEQAKDRLVFATVQLNRARQSAYRGDTPGAAVHLRAAEGAIAQAAVFVDAVTRFAAEPTASGDDAQAAADWLRARGAVADASDFVTTHRGVVGCEARTRLAEAERLLAGSLSAGTEDSARPPTDAEAAAAYALGARQLAERDVRVYGNPYGGPVGDGTVGAVLGGILLVEGDHPGAVIGPGSFGGSRTRGRRGGGKLFLAAP